MQEFIKVLHIRKFLNNARTRAKRDSVPFDLTKEYLLSIATDCCPIFNIPFEWGVSGKGHGNAKFNGPTLDRILPELGYIEGNVAFISYRANRIKDNGTMKEHYAIADWIWNHIHAKQEPTTPVPTGHDSESQNNSEHGTIHGARIGQDCDGAHHHIGESEGDNPHSGTKTSSGVGMDARMSEVGTFSTSESSKDYGYAKAKTDSIRKFVEHLRDQSREFGVAVGMWEDIRLSNIRREQPIQGPINETVQSLKEAFEIFQASFDSNWNSESTGTTRPMESGRDIGLGTKTGDKPNKI